MSKLNIDLQIILVIAPALIFLYCVNCHSMIDIEISNDESF